MPKKSLAERATNIATAKIKHVTWFDKLAPDQRKEIITLVTEKIEGKHPRLSWTDIRQAIIDEYAAEVPHQWHQTIVARARRGTY